MPQETDRQHERALRLPEEARRLAEAVRAACLEAAVRGYEDAKISGLCHEGAWECAVSAIRMLDLEPLVTNPEQTRTRPH